MKVCIISGRYPVSIFNSSINHKLYADKWGYTYINCNYPTKAKNPYLNKIYYILSYIDCYDYIVWIDDDAFFFDFNKDIMQFAPKGDHFISICKSPSFKELKTFLSSGQFILKRNDLSKKFLEDVLNTDLKNVKKWWRDDLGYFTKGDQDIMVYLLLEMGPFKKGYILHDYKEFNSRVENFFDEDTHIPFILHFTATPGIKSAKENNYKKIQKKLNLHSSLVSQNLLVQYHIKKEKRKATPFKIFLIKFLKGLKFLLRKIFIVL